MSVAMVKPSKTRILAFLLVFTTLTLDKGGESVVINPWPLPQVDFITSPKGSNITVLPVNEGIYNIAGINIMHEHVQRVL